MNELSDEVKNKSNRRDFLKTSFSAAAGLVLAFHVPSAVRGQKAAVSPTINKTFAPNAWLEIAASGTVTVFVALAEMGQGIRTSLPMILADELEADWSKVKVINAVSDPKYGRMDTGGSYSVRDSWLPLRKAGAAAREMLIRAAAEKWKVRPEDCFAEKGFVVNKSTKKRIGYGELIEAASRQSVPENPPFKDAKDFRLIGKNVSNVDGLEIVTGRAVYGFDFHVPGMLVASVERCPVFGGKLVSFDGSEAEKVPGVRHVVEMTLFGIPAAVAVIADNTWAAIKARGLLKIKWDEGENAKQNSAAISREFAAKARAKEDEVLRDDGDAVAALQTEKIEAVYETPYLAHACLETQNCVAQYKDGKCEIWGPIQYPSWVQGSVARTCGIKPPDVTVHRTLIGGGFGRRILPDYAAEAAQLSKKVNAPVQVVWSREDDMKNDYYRSASYHLLQASVKDKKPFAWRHRMVFPSISGSYDAKAATESESLWGALELPFAIPNFRVEYSRVQPETRLGWWRATRMPNVFATECFLDEIAEKCGTDPLEFRLRLLERDREVKIREANVTHNLSVERLKRVLKLAAEKAGWGKPLPKGRGRGIAAHAYFDVGTYVAQVAEVTVNDDGGVKVDRIICAVDCGTVINPDTVAAQMEGCVVYALSAVLGGEITLENGRIVQNSYRDYPVLQINQMPLVETFIVPSKEPPGGVGEPGVPPTAPAVVNAIFAATGKRLRRLPISAGDFSG